MATYYLLTELTPIALVLSFQRHIPPTAPLPSSSAFRILGTEQRDDAQLVSKDTPAALQPSFDADMSIMTDDSGRQDQGGRSLQYGSNRAPSPSASVAIGIPTSPGGGGTPHPWAPPAHRSATHPLYPVTLQCCRRAPQSRCACSETSNRPSI
jgi:hypothetical protein